MDGMLLKRGGDPSKLKTIDEHYIATEGQSVFPIEYVTFDYKRDRVDVISGRTVLSPELDYTVTASGITLVEGVPEGRTVTIRIMKNVNTDAEDKMMSGVYIEPNTIPSDRLAEQFLPLTGERAMTGNLNIKKTVPEIIMRNGENGRLINIFIGGENIFYARNTKDSNNRTALMLYPESDNNIHRLLSLQKMVDGTASYYNVYGTHNITCGTEDITAGTTPLTTGTIYQKYE